MVERSPHDTPRASTVWWWLVALVAAGLALLGVPRLGHEVVAPVLFVLAVAKAALVVRYYMHLRGRPTLLAAVALVPVALALLLAAILLPDIGWR